LQRTKPAGRSRASVEHAGRALTSASVLHGEHLEAVLVAISREPLLEHEAMLFEQGVAGLSLELARHRSVRDAHRARVDDLLEEVATGRATTELIERTTVRLRGEPLDTFRVLAIDGPSHGRSDHALCTVVEDALVPLGPPIVGRLDGTIHAIVPDRPDDPEPAALVEQAFRRRGWTNLVIGRSRTKTSADGLRSALREAGVALHLDGTAPVRDVDELGLPGLLAGIRDDLGASDFVTRVLGPVLDHDADGAGGLIATLRAYLAHGCRPGPAADELCIHRHTLAYRLDRVRDLTGRDPRSGEHLLEFGLALELLGRDAP
jgi:PucR family transcriptional regulator, purine catabolism regulatory protein